MTAEGELHEYLRMSVELQALDKLYAGLFYYLMLLLLLPVAWAEEPQSCLWKPKDTESEEVIGDKGTYGVVLQIRGEIPVFQEQFSYVICLLCFYVLKHKKIILGIFLSSTWILSACLDLTNARFLYGQE